MAGRAAGRSAAAGALASRADILWGVPGDLLAGRAVGAQMLVLGSYGEGASSGMLAGSLALALLDRVKCPVAVIRGSAPQVPPPGIGPVVVGVDGSPAGRAALTFAAGLAGSWAAPLVAVHVGRHRRRDSRRSPPPRPGDARGRSRRPVGSGARCRGVSHPDLTVQREVVGGTPVRALLARAGGARFSSSGIATPIRACCTAPPAGPWWSSRHVRSW